MQRAFSTSWDRSRLAPADNPEARSGLSYASSPGRGVARSPSPKPPGPWRCAWLTRVERVTLRSSGRAPGESSIARGLRSCLSQPRHHSRQHGHIGGGPVERCQGVGFEPLYLTVLGGCRRSPHDSSRVDVELNRGAVAGRFAAAQMLPDRDRYAQLLFDLAHQRRPGAFARLDLAARELPLASCREPGSALGGKAAALLNDGGSDYSDDVHGFSSAQR